MINIKTFHDKYKNFHDKYKNIVIFRIAILSTLFYIFTTFSV